MAWDDRPGSRRALHRLGAGPRADRLARRHAVAARSRRRSRHRAAPDPVATSRLVIQPTVALVPHRHAAGQTPVTVKMGSKLIDIPAGERDHVVTDTLRAAGAGRSAERVSARALPRQGDARHRDTAGRRRQVAAPHPALELPLAAGLPLRHADSAAARHDADDALHLRQFGGERRQPAPPAGAGASRARIDRRDGGARAAGVAEVAGGRGAARAGRSTSATRSRTSRWGRCA